MNSAFTLLLQLLRKFGLPLFFFLVFPLFVSAQTTIVSYNFNSTNEGWTPSSGSWVRNNGSFPQTSGNHWRIATTSNNYADNINASVTSPALNLSGHPGSDLELSISVRYQTAVNQVCIRSFFICLEYADFFDGMRIEYSTNGSTWHPLGNRGEGSNWYNNSNIETLGTGWAGNNGNWETAKIILPTELAGQSSVRFRVRFVSNGTATALGAAFDNVSIVAKPPLFSPADGDAPGGVSNNLSLWLKADQEVKETDGAAYAWGDRSGNNNHAFQSNGNFQPQFIQDALNGNPVVYFEQGPYLDGGAGFNTQQYFLVLDPNEIYNSTNAVGRIMGFEPGGFSHLAFGPSSTYSGNEIITHAVGYDGGFRAFQENDESNYGNPSLIVSQNNRQTNPNSQILFNNGQEINTRQHNAFRNLSNQGYRLGDVFYWTSVVGDAPYNGRIAELISYSSVLTNAQRRDVETYLAIKYGITLDISTQNYTVNGAAIYDNKNYAKDIAGIGRNLATQGLSQTASKSVNQGAIIKISNPSSLDNGDYLVWGDDGGPVSWLQAQVPAGNVDRFARTWFVRETGNVGTVDVSINLNQLGIDIDNSTVNLFQAPAGASIPNTFSTATAHTNGVRSVNNEGQIIVTFHGINFNNGEYFTIGGDIQTTSPGGVKDNLSMWFKADGGLSLNGNSVMRWSDYSGNANDVYQGNNSLRPTFVENQINYNPAINFDNDYLDGIDGFYTQDYFVVAKPNALVNRNNQQGALLGFESGLNSGLAIGNVPGPNLSNEIVTHYLNSGYVAAYTMGSNTALNSPLLINSKNNAAGNRQEVFIDGALLSNTNTGTFRNISDTELRIGSTFNGNPFSGQIAEVISYSSRLNDTRRREVETYLAIKYGITLNISSQAYISRGNSIYNYTGYSNNIAGIARDLDNGFNQTRSKSINSGAVVEMESTSLPNRAYVVWGKDNGSATLIQTSEIPTQFDERIQAEYRVSVTGAPGAVTVKIDIGELPNFNRRSKTANFYSLLISKNNNFSSINAEVSAAEIVGNTLVFQNVLFENGDYFTLAVPAIPSIGVNNSLWLRADRGVSLNGSQVTGWNDQSGLNNNATAGASRPTLSSAFINGNDAITFNGPVLNGAAGFYTREYFVMAAPDIDYTPASNGAYILGFEPGQVSGMALGNSVSTWTNEVLSHITTDRHIAFRSNQTFRGSTIINSRNSNGANPQTLWVNGNNLSVSSTGTLRNLDNTQYRLGNNFNSTRSFNGKIGEVLSFSTTQSTAEKRNVETYLALKYGITLNAGGGNYTLGGTTIFNMSTFSAYNNDVVGIISYAKYDFLQTSSRSIYSSGVLTISNASSLNNNDFIVIGNNAGAMTSTTSDLPERVGERVQRIWAVQMTNSPGNVTLSFDLSGLSYGSKTTNDFSLILDNNANFANGIIRLQTPTSWDGQILTFTNVNLSGVSYFGIGTGIDLISDTDQDGIPDYFELAYGTDPNNGNSPVNGGSPYTDNIGSTGINGDGISDALERILINHGATGPVTRYTDTDGDGIPDWIEVKNGTNPFNPNSPLANGNLDSDGDGLPNALEFLIAQKGGTANPSLTSDKDGDGVPDFLEIINNTNPDNGNDPVVSGGADSDGDGVTNAMEAIILAGGASGPVTKDSDTDEDGIPDYIEAITHTDPFNQGSPFVPNNMNIRNVNADFSVTNSCVEISGHQWINVLDDAGRLVFSINAVGNNLGPTCYGIRILRGMQAVRTNGTHYVMNRNWWITPTTQPSGEKVYVRFYAQGQEMADLWGKSVDVGMITPDVDEAAFSRDYLRFTKIGSLNTLDPLVSGGDRAILAPKVLPFKGNDRMFTIGVDGFSSFIPYASGSPTPLPVELLYFTGRVSKQKVELEWATASEISNDYFVVERSRDGLQFESVLKVEGSGDSNRKLTYNSVDSSPLSGKSYYRLKQVDYDGQFSYSSLISIEESGIQNTIRLYPNPANEEINLQFDTDLGGLTPGIALFDVSGGKCNVKIKQDDSNRFIIELANLSAGAYMVEVIYNNSKVVKLIIKE